MRQLFILFLLIKCPAFAQVMKSVGSLIFIDIQGNDHVIQQYYLFPDKDTVEYRVEQSENDFVKKFRINTKASQKIINEAMTLIENVKIDPAKELDLHPSHFLRITVSYNQQQKTVYIDDKYYYLLLENIFKTINSVIPASIQIPLKSISFSKNKFVPSDKTNHSSFSADWRHSFFSNNPKNKFLLYNSDNKDSIRITIGAECSKMVSIEKKDADSLRILTLACINNFKFSSDVVAKPLAYELFEVYHHTKRHEILVTFSSFEMAKGNTYFTDLKKYINRQVLPANPLD